MDITQTATRQRIAVRILNGGQHGVEIALDDMLVRPSDTAAAVAHYRLDHVRADARLVEQRGEGVPEDVPRVPLRHGLDRIPSALEALLELLLPLRLAGVGIDEHES